MFSLDVKRGVRRSAGERVSAAFRLRGKARGKRGPATSRFVDDQRVGAVMRAMRLRRGLRQVDVAVAAGVSAQTVSRLERGRLETFSLRVIRAIGRVLEVRFDLAPWSRHGDLMRFATADHAALVEAIVREVRVLGWEARAEVSFSEFGERGFIDVLAWHAPTRTLLVTEVKTQIVDIGETAGVLDRKRRLGPRVAAGLGWDPALVSTALIVRKTRTNERRVAEHRATLAGLLPLGTRSFRAWLRHPKGAIGAVAFWAPVSASISRRRAVRRANGPR